MPLLSRIVRGVTGYTGASLNLDQLVELAGGPGFSLNVSIEAQSLEAGQSKQA